MMVNSGLRKKRYEGKFHESFFDEVYLITYRLLERLIEHYERESNSEFVSILNEYLNHTMKSVESIRLVDVLVPIVEIVEVSYFFIEQRDPFFRVRDYERFKRLDEIFSTKEVESKDN